MIKERFSEKYFQLLLTAAVITIFRCVCRGVRFVLFIRQKERVGFKSGVGIYRLGRVFCCMFGYERGNFSRAVHIRCVACVYCKPALRLEYGVI